MDARLPASQPVRTVALSDWDGASVRSRALVGHERSTQHHISVHGHGATVTLAIRLRPTRLGHTLVPLQEMEAIALSPTNPSRDFVVNGFFDLIEVRPLSTPVNARIEVTVASSGNTLNALPRTRPGDFVTPPTTVLALEWDGDTEVEKGLLGHDHQTVHHFAMACDGVPTGGRVRVSARPRGADGFVTIVERDLAGDGCVNALITGYFDAVRVEPLAPITGGVRFGIRVASAGEELREPEVPGDNSIRASGIGGGQTPQRVSADTTFTVGADAQVLYAVPIELEDGALLEVLGTLVEIVDPAGMTALVKPLANQVIPSGGDSVLSLGKVVYDTGGFFDPAQPDRITAPVSGYYRVGFCVNVNTPSTPTAYAVGAFIRINGQDFEGRAIQLMQSSQLSDYLTATSPRLWLEAGDYVTLLVVQESGSNRSVSALHTWLSIQHEE